MRSRRGASNAAVLAVAVVIALLGLAVGVYFALQPPSSAGGGQATIISTVAGSTTTATVTITVPTLVTISGAQGSAKVLATIQVGSTPQGIAIDPANGEVYVALTNSSSVAVINASSNKVVTTIALTKGSLPAALGFDPVNNMVYVANLNSTSLSVINAATNTAATPIKVNATTNGIAINAATNTIYAASGDGDSLFVISGATSKVIAITDHKHIPDNAQSVSVDPNRNIVSVGNLYSNKAYAQFGLIDGAKNTVIAEVNITGGGALTGVAANPNTGMTYVANYKGNLVNVVSESTAKPIANVSVPSPYDVAVNPFTNRVFVASMGSNSVVVISGVQNTILGTIAVGKGPISIAVNTNTNIIYVANHLDGTVSVIDGSSLGF